MIEFKSVRVVSFNLEDVKEFLSFLEALDENLEGSGLPSRFDSRIVLEITIAHTGSGGARLRSGYWEVRNNPYVVYLASRPSGNDNTSPTLRSRAILLLCALEVIARGVSLDEDTARRREAQERRLLSYLPMREVVRMIPRQVFTACGDARHDAEEVFGVAASADGEILAVKQEGRWIDLRGEVVTIPRDAVVVEW